VNIFVWAAPVLLVVLGGAWVIGSVSLAGRRRAQKDAAAATASSASPTPSDPALAEYLRRVREESR
jgi:cytochrome c-type biogenesis protein CcmH/NrfF